MSLILGNLLKSAQRCCGQISAFSTAVDSQVMHAVKPIITTQKYLDEDYLYMKKRQVWIENLDEIVEKKIGLSELHPAIFADRPRVDVLYQNIRWQRMYRYIVRTLFAN